MTLHLILASALSMASVPGDTGSDVRMVGPMAAPLWEAAQDEAPFLKGVTFAACDDVITKFALQTNERATNRRYSTSPRWGKILRVTLVDVGAGIATPLVCWGSDASVQIVVGPPEGGP